MLVSIAELNSVLTVCLVNYSKMLFAIFLGWIKIDYLLIAMMVWALSMAYLRHLLVFSGSLPWCVFLVLSKY